jgi:Spy/CpxP family protein refolding chaperone
MTSDAHEPSTPPPTTTAPRARSRTLQVVLAVSLAFNVFVLGFIAARAFRPHGHDRTRGPFLGPHGLLDDAEPGARPAVERVMKRHRTAMRSEHRELRDARRAVRKAFEAEPFDPKALERALAGLRARTESSQARVHAALVELASELPKDARKRLGRRAHMLDGNGGPPQHRR